jgi:hypothetical protein
MMRRRKLTETFRGWGGVFNVVNLHVYHYAGNNPVKYTDPDGRANSDVNIRLIVNYLRRSNVGRSALDALKSGQIKVQAYDSYTEVRQYYTDSSRTTKIGSPLLQNNTHFLDRKYWILR